MSEHPILGLMGATLEKVRELCDAETVIGKPITVSEDTVIIPVSKLSVGYASGGSDFPSKSQKDLFGGGGGAGISVTPKAFLVIENGNVRLLQIAKDGESVDRFCNLIPDTISQITSLIGKAKKDKKGNNEG